MDEAPDCSDRRAICGVPSHLWRAGQQRRFQMIRRWVSLDGSRVLDVGCGVGMYTAAFLRETPAVYGVEIDYDCALEAAGRAAGVALALCEALPFAEGTFDVILSHEVLEHTSDDRTCLEEMVRVVRPGGRIAIFVPNRLYPFETHGIFWRGSYRFGNVPLVNWLPGALRTRLAPHVRAYTSRSLAQLLDGLPVRQIRKTTIYPGYDNVIARARTAGRALRTIMHGLERTPLCALGLSHFLVVERV